MNKNLKREFWKKHISAYASGGQSQKEYCEEHGLALTTFIYWKRKIVIGAEAKSHTQNKQPCIVPIPLESLGSLESGEFEEYTQGRQSAKPINLYVADIRLEVVDGFSQKTLHEVLCVLKML